MNLVQMRDSLRSKIGNPSTTDVADTVLNGHLNAAQLFIAGRYAFDQARKLVTFATVANTGRYTLPTDLLVILRLWDGTNFRKLTKRSMRFVSQLSKTPTAGKPTSYVRIGSSIELLPAPGDVYTMSLYYIAAPATLAADADIPVIPQSWHDGIVLKARHMYYDERGDVAKAIYASNAWKDWLSDKPSEVDLEKDDADFGIELPELEHRYGSLQSQAEYHALFDYTE